ncbi:hypothetical protein [Mycobacterium sp. D16R24]|uniref:hypothetical protein n=1 Tax=Mycobacterium sp. D16R24 TaxID=1855656 RepID=UPI000992F89B|nr:hypothetical protein [Mycobacterium sp. D16R24]
MFDDWCNPAGIEIYREVNRPVLVRANQVFGGEVGLHQMTLAPALARQHGLVFNPLQPGHQFAWVRTNTGSWLALVVVEVATADGANQLAMQLWLQPHQFQLPHRDYR